MRKNKSFTIVEILVAMSIFTLVIGGSMALIQQTLVMINLANQKLTAYYLAQEAIELARNIRDNNWIEQNNNNAFPWYNGFPNTPFTWPAENDPIYNRLNFEIDYNDPYNNTIDIDSANPEVGASTLTNVKANGDALRYLSHDSNGYFYDGNLCTSPSSNPNCTIYQRYLRIGMNDGGIRIECHVRWKAKGKGNSFYNVVVKEKLYNWYGF